MGGSASNGVSKSLRTRIRRTLAAWDLAVDSMDLVAWKKQQQAGVWRVETKSGTRCVKLSSRPLDRCRFTADAHEHLTARGARVPALYRTLTGEPFAQVGEQALSVTQWIDLQEAPNDVDGARALSAGLGAFHRLGSEFTPSAEARFHTRLGQWATTYATSQQKAYQLARTWRGRCDQESLLRSLLDRLCRQADSAVQSLQSSGYHALAAKGERYWGLVHRDPSWTNIQVGPDGVYLIDLDSVVFDLPVSDLGLFMHETLDRRGRWDSDWVAAMLDGYREAYPLEPELFDLLLIELARPTMLYKRLRKLLKKSGAEASEESLLRLLALDHTRWKALSALGLEL
ncbi:MAG TPA: CotS family spore coat protein [Symbiobacteriaceae bacterium]|nr:CotS family spore coat protein [Symbiobacteriaceae bacterium]